MLQVNSSCLPERVNDHDGFEELNDLKTDPNAFTNLAGALDMIATKARLSQGLPTPAAPHQRIPPTNKVQSAARPQQRRQAIAK
ncbi:hypothetical protein Rcae01_06454 [Novipirellula caenicola]|uniref:Uncharacterized protein n=1 Tax=Novipirellula caenicola TaxID=1536901 RepID=A0ABP9W0N1_9BACT